MTGEEDAAETQAAPIGSAARVQVSVVVPAYNAESHLAKVLGALKIAHPGGEILVVDAGSTDATAELAEQAGVRLIRLPERAGPAEARNVGARAVDSPVLLFIDSDCVAHPDVVDRVRQAFSSEPQLVTLTGSYDASPPDPGFFSQYMNLRHHFTHQVARREPATFWAGCGAVRRETFLEQGGFDAGRYPRPQIEDIELGMRMANFGRTRLDPALNVTHLKRWTLRSVVETDVLARAVPWSRLILESGALPNDLNLRSSQRVAAAIAPFALLSPLALLLFAWSGNELGGALASALLVASLLLNRGLLAFFARTRGVGFAVKGWAFHQVHLSYSALTFAVCSVAHRLQRGEQSA